MEGCTRIRYTCVRVCVCTSHLTLRMCIYTMNIFTQSTAVSILVYAHNMAYEKHICIDKPEAYQRSSLLGSGSGSQGIRRGRGAPPWGLPRS